MKTINYKLNNQTITLEVNFYGSLFNVSSEIGVLISGYIDNGKFHIQSEAKEVYYFSNDVMKKVIKQYKNF